MIQGRVRGRDDLEAEITIRVVGPGERSQEVVAVIDTGFTGDLTLGPLMIDRLGLAFQSNIPVQLAGERAERSNLYKATVELDGERIDVDVLEFEGDALVGTGLLRGFRLCIHVTAGGEVTVRRP